MIGIDIVKIERIKKIFDRFGQKFLDRIYTEQELSRLKRRLNQKLVVAELAGRFAAKEAVSKALGVGVRKIGAGSEIKRASWQEIEIVNLPTGEPVVNLYGKTAKIARERDIGRVQVSLSHEKDYAIAIALATTE